MLPAPASALVAAFERHTGPNGFDIGLVDTVTGRSLVVPSSVNTTADEFHPALSPDGRYLVFSRTTLVPQPDGDVVPPAARQVLMLDRRTGTIRAPISTRAADAGAGATIVPTGGTLLAYGLRPAQPESQTLVAGALGGGSAFTFSSRASSTAENLQVNSPAQEPAGTFADVPHAAVTVRSAGFLRVVTYARFSQGTGDLGLVRTILQEVPSNPNLDADAFTLPSGAVPRHATPRTGDGHVALDQLTDPFNDTGADIATLQFPGDAVTSLMPAPVRSGRDERMPAWSPDGVQLGFVRATIPHSATTRRELFVFDSTTGVQDFVNPAIDIGTEAPTFKLRAFQHTWGGLSLANASADDSVLVSCGFACSGTISGPTGSGIALSPVLRGGTVRVGIVISRRIGTRRLFGRSVPKLRFVGRVPLGLARSRRPRFRWDGRVNGRRLKPGTYYLTFRAVTRRTRVLALSRSIRFTVTRSGRLTRPRPSAP